MLRTVTVRTLAEKKARGEKIVMLTAHDWLTARLLDAEQQVDVVLVGDSLANTALGYADTLPVTMDEMVHHTAAVSRAVTHALVVADMPFLSYQAGEDAAVGNAGRFLKEAGANAVKLEGGARFAPLVARLTGCGIPVIGHLGLTPQSVNQLAGYHVQGKLPADIRQLRLDARALQDADACALVLECVPAEVAERLTADLRIPTVGIGAGAGCDGQVLVGVDLWGLYDRHVPKFVRAYADLGAQARAAVRAYADEVRAGTFPDAAHSFTLTAEQRAALADLWK
jgi:3-methyl-2-oxobutanoate hydroxymethyltransferase